VPEIQLENDASKQAHPSSSANAGKWPWHWVSLALVILWIGTVLGWWWSRRRQPKTPPVSRAAPTIRPNESQARERFLSACKINDAATARRALLEWTQARWPDSPPAGLRALANRLDDSNIDTLLIELDRACFAGGEWNGAALAKALSRLPSASSKQAASRSELAELYP
jgi:hypothetical protein